MAAAAAAAAAEEEAGEEIRVRVCSPVNSRKEEEVGNPNFSGGDDRRGNHDCSGSSSSSSPPLSGSCISWQCGEGADRLVKIEIDAANALAEFAQLALLASKRPERGFGGLSAGKWGNKGRRSKNRCKNVFPARVYRNPLPDCNFTSRRFQDQFLNKGQDRTQSTRKNTVKKTVKDQFLNKGQDRNQSTRKNTVKKTVKVPRDIELLKPSFKRSASNISLSQSKLKQNLSEVEKEERRLRRVQANRESARQTIKRRQVLYEELTKKAADLAWDNKNMKREKELAKQQYLALKNKNKHLKEQVAKKIKDEAKQSPLENISSQIEPQASPPVQFPLFVYNGTPFTPFVWPSTMQPFNHLQKQQIPQNNTDPSRGLGCFGGNSRPRSPFYLLPCPWFLPLTDQSSGSRVGFSGDGEHVTELSRKTMGNAESRSFQNGDNVSTSGPAEATTSKDSASKILTESPATFSEDKGSQMLGSCFMGVTQIPACGNINHNSSANCDNELLPDSSSKEAVSSFATCPVGNSAETLQGASIYQSRKMVDAAVATEARKRRKELTKLKHFNNKKLRL